MSLEIQNRDISGPITYKGLPTKKLSKKEEERVNLVLRISKVKRVSHRSVQETTAGSMREAGNLIITITLSFKTGAL